MKTFFAYSLDCLCQIQFLHNFSKKLQFFHDVVRKIANSIHLTGSFLSINVGTNFSEAGNAEVML